MIKQTDWYGCYKESWSDDIIPAAYSHPAKYARGLIRQIYQHAFERGYLKPGDHIIDPFGGVALGALDAAQHGLNWTGVELEGNFVALGNANLSLWRDRYARHFPGWCTARLLHGNSQELCRVIGEASGGSDSNLGYWSACVSSPPYEKTATNLGSVGNTPGFGQRIGPAVSRKTAYGITNGQLGNKQGDHFWSAAALIVAQVHQILKPGGVAIWVTGDFVRRRQRVMFGEKWADLCKTLNVTAIEHIRVWRTEHNGTQSDMFGDDKHYTTDRVSFFRRLANEKNPDNAILNEDVWIMEKQ